MKKVNSDTKDLISSFKIIIVEDDEGLNRLIQKKLQREGFSTSSVFMGKEVYSTIKNEQNEILLLDYSLPDENAEEIIQKLINRKKLVPFLIMTGKGDEKIAVEMMKLGALDYLIKDQDFTDILVPKLIKACDIVKKDRNLKIAQQELRDRQIELEQIFQAIPDALVYADTQRKITRVNPAFTRIFGYKPDEVMGKKTKIIYAHPEDFIEQGKIRYNKEARYLYEPYDIEYRRKNGEIFPSETIGTPVRDTRDNVIGLLGIVRDITKRKQAEQELRESNKRYIQLIDALNEGIWRIDEKGLTTFVNPKMAEMLGYSMKEMIGKHLFDFMDKEWKNIAKNKLDDRRKGISEIHEFTFNKKNGEPVYALVNTTSIIDDDGNFTGALAGVTDITTRKQAQHKLKATKDFLDKVIEKSPLSLWISDKHGNIERVNQALCDALGLTKKQIIGHYNILQDKNIKNLGLLPRVQEVFKEYRPVRFWIPWKAKQSGVRSLEKGKDVYIDATLFPILDSDNNLTNVVCQWIDITKQKENQKELQKHKEHLQEMVEERTKELEKKNDDLERFNRLFIGREYRIKKLKDQVRLLEKRLAKLEDTS